MIEYVVDASAVVDGLFGDLAISRGADRLHAPTLLDYEVLSALRRGTLHRVVTASVARESLELFLATDIERHEAGRLLRRTWELRHDLSAYDASYVALAEALGIPLLTLDDRLAATARRWCEVVDV